MKQFVLLLFTITIIIKGYSQENPKNDTLKIPKITLSVSDDRAKKLLPQYTPLSPNAWSFQKFGDYQVTLATGIPSISIPLFTIQKGSLSIPITLNCHTGGFKINEQASWVGLGWALDIGASLNRAVQGEKDDRDGGSYMSNPITASKYFCTSLSDFSYGTEASKNKIDTHPDIYSYHLLNKNGKFILGQLSSPPFKIPNYPINISYSGSPSINTFNLIGDDGIAYTFAEGESQNVTSGANTQTYNSSWLISQIKSPNSDDLISYSYQDGGTQSFSEKQWLASIIFGATGGYYQNSTSFTPSYTMASTTIFQKNPYKITYTNGEIEFVQSNLGERQDLTNSRFLKQINVYNYENGSKVLIKVIKFTYSYFSGIRLKLDKITITDALSTTVEEYSFSYWSNSISWNEINDSEKQDYFGYYNGKLNNHLISINSYNGLPIYGGAADRSTVSTYMKEGVLKTITYPSKGFTEFDFETNKYHDGTNELLAGGLRVKSIKNVTANSSTMKRYEYSSAAGAGRGQLTTNWTPTSSNIPILQGLHYADNAGLPTSHGDATQASFTQNGGPLSLYTMDSAPVYYTNVTEYFEDLNDINKNGKNVYTYDYRFDFIASPSNYTSRDVQPWKRGNLLSKTTYDSNNNPIAVTTNTYQEYNSNSIYGGAVVSVPHIYEGNGAGSSDCPLTGFKSNNPQLNYGPVTYHTGINLVSSNTNIIDNVSTTTTNSYNNELYLSQIQTNDSQTSSSKTETYKYPSDASYISNSVIQEMLVRNQRNQPLETQIQETILGTTTTLYKDKKVFDLFTGTNSRGLSNNILPKEIWSAPKGGTLEKRVSFTDYATNGNPLSYTVDDMPISLVWGYNNALLIGEVKNATKGQVDAGLSAAGITATGISVTDLSSTHFTQLQTLRNTLSNSLITWYIYRPQVGLSGTVSPNGLYNSFTYDKLNRLRSIKDHNSYLTDLYSYVYATTNGCTTPAPTISISSSSICGTWLNAINCSGTVNWSNGMTGNSVYVPTQTTTVYSATCTASGCTSASSNTLTLPTLPVGWSQGDMGIANGCTQNNSGTLNLRGSGTVGGTDDTMHWIYKQISGNVTIIAKISSIPAIDGTRTGIMLRNSLNSNSTDFTIFQDGNSYVGLFRRESDGSTNLFSGFQQASLNATWIKLVKVGNQLSYYFSTNANPEANNAWLNTFAYQNGASFPQTIPFGSTFYIGFAVWGNLNQVSLSNITINGQPF